MTTPSPPNARWRRARESLARFAPKVSSFLPDDILCSLADGLQAPAWQPIQGFEHAGDFAIWEQLRQALQSPDSEEVIIVADKSYWDDVGPFELDINGIAALTEDFVERYQDTMFGGDVVLLAATEMLLVHHNGLFTVVHRVGERRQHRLHATANQEEK